MKKTSKTKPKKFLVKEDDGIFTVFDEYFNEIQNRDEALLVALRTLGELHSTLLDEGGTSDSLYIGNIKVSTGLQRALDELDRRWPFLMTELYSSSRRVNGYSVVLN